MQIDVARYTSDSVKLQTTLSALRDSIAEISTKYKEVINQLKADESNAKQASLNIGRLRDSVNHLVSKDQDWGTSQQRLVSLLDSLQVQLWQYQTKELLALQGIRAVGLGYPVISQMEGSQFPTDENECHIHGANFGDSKGTVLVEVSCSFEAPDHSGFAHLFTPDTLRFEQESISTWQDTSVVVELTPADLIRIANYRLKKLGTLCPKLFIQRAVLTKKGQRSNWL